MLSALTLTALLLACSGPAPDVSAPDDSAPDDSDGADDSASDDSGPDDSGADDSGPDDSGPGDTGPLGDGVSGDCFALVFDGRGQHVDTQAAWPTAPGEAMTVEAWVNINDPSGHNVIFSSVRNVDGHKYFGAELAVVDGSLVFLVGLEQEPWLVARSSASAIPSQRWLHVAGSYLVSGSGPDVDAYVWINGQRVAEDHASDGRGFALNDQDALIGVRPAQVTLDNPDFYWNGMIHSIHVQAAAPYGSGNFTPDTLFAPTRATRALWALNAPGGQTASNLAGGAGVIAESAAYATDCPR